MRILSRHMLAHLFLGLAVLVATALWATSWWRHYQVLTTFWDTEIEGQMRAGDLLLDARRGNASDVHHAQVWDPSDYPHVGFFDVSAPLTGRLLCFEWGHDVRPALSLFSEASSRWAFRSPAWVPAALISGVWGLALIRTYRRARSSRRTGRCQGCGYDLRATPEDISRYPLNYACRFCAGRGR